jgi:DNA-binding GntR family transcriptional regulator
MAGQDLMDGVDGVVRPGSRDSTAVIHNEVRAAILKGEIEPQSWISQVQLARRFGVSRGPVREALRLLEHEGLVEAEINRRVRVAALSVEDLEHLYGLRIVNESLGIRLSVPQFEAADLDRLNSLLERVDPVPDQDLDAWERPHREFHQALVGRAGGRILRLVDQLYDHSERYRRVYITGDPQSWSTGAAEHRAIVEACVQGEANQAAALLARHLSRTALTVLALISPEHDPGAVRAAVRQVTDS